jgi:hypothetical protein
MWISTCPVKQSSRVQLRLRREMEAPKSYSDDAAAYKLAGFAGCYGWGWETESSSKHTGGTHLLACLGEQRQSTACRARPRRAGRGEGRRGRGSLRRVVRCRAVVWTSTYECKHSEATEMEELTWKRVHDAATSWWCQEPRCSHTQSATLVGSARETSARMEEDGAAEGQAINVEVLIGIGTV